MRNPIGLSALSTTNVNGNALLSLALTTVGVVGLKTLPLGARNISLAESGGYTYLGVFNDSSVLNGNPPFSTLSILGAPFSLLPSGKSYCFATYQATDIAPAAALIIGATGIAVNAAGQIIGYDATTAIGVPDEEDVIYIGSLPSRVVRKGANWYLACCPFAQQ